MKNKKKIIFLGILIAVLLIVIYIFSSRYYLYNKANSYKMLSNEEINIVSEEKRELKESDSLITIDKVSADFKMLLNDNIKCEETKETDQIFKTYCTTENHNIYVNKMKHIEKIDELINTNLFDVNGINNFFVKITKNDIDYYNEHNKLIDFNDLYYHVLKDNYKSIKGLTDLRKVKNTLIYNAIKDKFYTNPKETYFITYDNFNVIFNKISNNTSEIIIESGNETYTILLSGNEIESEKILGFIDSIKIK